MIDFVSITKQESDYWRFAWTGDSGATYRIVFEGKEIDTTAAEYYDAYFPGYKNAPPDIEVVLDGEQAASERNTPRLIIQWHSVSDATAYRVEWLNGSAAWVLLDQIAAGAGVEVFQYRTELLTDETEYQLRIVPVNGENKQGDPQYFRQPVVRVSKQAAALDYDCTGGTLTISEA